ncbi:hypothetical protein RAM80_02000 [Pseudomonas sp. App30]|uniref:hypothetical protein n=1 Tax=Pseudomonas sp. App30 TaxID=3068990 RepID=UPI003A8008C6
MSQPKDTRPDATATQPPGEVERDNDAHRSSKPGQPNRESTAQSTAQKAQPKPRP